MFSIRNKLRRVKWNLKSLLLKQEETYKGKYLILLYHGIVPKNNLKFNLRFIEKKDFYQQIKLISNKFNLVSLNDIYKDNLDPERLNIAITFDDGYKNNYSIAAEILKEFNTPATFFITTVKKEGYPYLWADYLDITSYYGHGKLKIDNIEFYKKHEFISDKNETLKQICKKTGFDFKQKMIKELSRWENNLYSHDNRNYWELMDENEINELSKDNLFTIGSHGLFHNSLESVSLNEASDEFSESKLFLEKITGKEVEYFAYPDGSYNSDLIEEAEKIGYKYQLLVEYRYDDKNDHRLKERFGINPFLNPKSQIKYISYGKYL